MVVYELDADSNSAQEVEDGTFIETPKDITRTRRHVQLLEWPGILAVARSLNEVGPEVGDGQPGKAFGDDLRIADIGMAREPVLLTVPSRILSESVQYFSGPEQLVTPIVSVVHEDQHAAGGELLRHKELRLSVQLPLPSAIQVEHAPATVTPVQVVATHPVLLGHENCSSPPVEHGERSEDIRRIDILKDVQSEMKPHAELL
jgi:hypothetical protein